MSVIQIINEATDTGGKLDKEQTKALDKLLPSSWSSKIENAGKAWVATYKKDDEVEISVSSYKDGFEVSVEVVKAKGYNYDEGDFVRWFNGNKAAKPGGNLTWDEALATAKYLLSKRGANAINKEIKKRYDDQLKKGYHSGKPYEPIKFA